MRNEELLFLIPHLLNAVYAVKVGDFDTACCAVFGTDAKIGAVGAFGVIYDGNIINNFYSVEWAYTLTFFAADTAVEAVFSCNSPFVVVAARHDNIFCICHKGYKPVRTGSRTKSAAHAVNGIYDGNICSN